jgi:hypothetical protein
MEDRLPIFPDLAKAEAATSLADLIDSQQGRELFVPAENERLKQSKQYRDNFCTFVNSQTTAINAGNKNACIDKNQAETQAQQQLSNNNQTNGLQTKNNRLTNNYGRGKDRVQLPKTRNAGLTANRRPRSIANVTRKTQPTPRQTYSIPQLGKQGEIDADRQRMQYQRFVQAQAGSNKTQLGDRAVFYSANGTPLYGDEVLRQADKKNLSANLATGVPPVTKPPERINLAKPVKGNIDRVARAQSKPKSNTAGNMLVLLGIAGAVSAIMFALQYVVQIVAFVMNIQNLMNTTTNLAGSFLNLFNNVGSLLGMGANLTKPIGDTIDGILNNVFGKKNVEEAKFQVARINTVFTAGVNILDGVRSASATLGNAVAQGANNTSRLGNLLMSAGIIDRKAEMFEENISVQVSKGGKLADAGKALTTIANVSNELVSITSEVKSAKDELEELEKNNAEQQRQKAEAVEKGKDEATQKYTDSDVSYVVDFSRSIL